MDRVQPLKIEDPETSGGEFDFVPTALNKNQDYIDCRGLTLQDGYSNDSIVKVERTNSTNELVFSDSALNNVSLYDVFGTFGRNYIRAVSKERTTTTSLLFQTKTTLILPILTGVFLCQWYAVLDTRASNKFAHVRLYDLTTSTMLGEELSCSGSGSSDKKPFFGTEEIVLNNESKTLAVQFNSPSGNTSVAIQNASIMIWRVG